MTHDQRLNTTEYPRHEHPGTNTFVYQQPPGEPVLWPLEHEQEAMLLQHYIDNVALFVSLESPRKRKIMLTIASLT